MIGRIIKKLYEITMRLHSDAINKWVDGYMNNSEVRIILEDKTLKKYHNHIHVTDDTYRYTTYSKMKKLVKINPVKFRKYQKQLFDCDDFAFSFMGMFRNLMPGFAVGMVFVEIGKIKHALNFFIDHNGNVVYIEPQTNEIFETNKYIPYFWLI